MFRRHFVALNMTAFLDVALRTWARFAEGQPSIVGECARGAS